MWPKTPPELPLEYTSLEVVEGVLAMLGKHSGCWTVAIIRILEHVGRDSFYGFLAATAEQLFRDEDFAALYCPDNGRPSVPPSLLATALLLQAYDGVSDEEAKARADFDLRWKVALGVGLEERPFAKSTLQVFRAQLILHEQVRAVFQQSLAFARRTGYFRSAQGSRPRWTRATSWAGARSRTPTTCWPTGSSRSCARLAARAGSSPEEWAAEHGLARYFGSSLKGEAAIDWDDPEAREVFLGRRRRRRPPARPGRGTRSRACRPTTPSAGGCGRRPTCWRGCCCRTSSAGRTGRAPAGRQPGPGRVGARPGDAPRAQERQRGASTATRRPSPSTRRASSSRRRTVLPGNAAGPRAGAGAGRAGGSERRGRGRGDGGRLRLRRRRDPPGVRRRRADAGGEGRRRRRGRRTSRRRPSGSTWRR